MSKHRFQLRFHVVQVKKTVPGTLSKTHQDINVTVRTEILS